VGERENHSTAVVTPLKQGVNEILDASNPPPYVGGYGSDQTP